MRLVGAADRPDLAGRVRLGQALAELARDLAASRREIAGLARENAESMPRLDLGGPK